MPGSAGTGGSSPESSFTELMVSAASSAAASTEDTTGDSPEFDASGSLSPSAGARVVRDDSIGESKSSSKAGQPESPCQTSHTATTATSHTAATPPAPPAPRLRTSSTNLSSPPRGFLLAPPPATIAGVRLGRVKPDLRAVLESGSGEGTRAGASVSTRASSRTCGGTSGGTDASPSKTSPSKSNPSPAAVSPSR